MQIDNVELASKTLKFTNNSLHVNVARASQGSNPMVAYEIVAPVEKREISRVNPN